MLARARTDWTTPAAVVVAGGVVMIVGGLLPWLGRVDGSLSNGPANNSGLLMIVAGVVVLVAISALVLDGYGPTRWLVLLGGAIGLVDTVYEAFVKHNIHVGIGIWIALIGSIIVIIASVAWRSAKPSASS